MTDLTRYRIDLCEHDSFQRLSYLSCARHEIGDGWCKGSSIEVDSMLQDIANAWRDYPDSYKLEDDRTFWPLADLLDELVKDE